jgi:hypothetical protein
MAATSATSSVTSSTTSTNAVTLVLSDLTADVNQFASQFELYLQQNPTWIGNLTTQTSQTLIELISTVGTFAQARIMREAEDAFAETAQSDSAVYAITTMQGLRMTRYLPANMQVTLSSPSVVSFPPYSQFNCGGNYFFNQTQITIDPSTPSDNTVTLWEGQLSAYSMPGLGTERQTFMSEQNGFVISDRDVQVQVNGIIIPKAYGGLWSFDGLPGYADITTSDGRLLLQFGNLGGNTAQFGELNQFATIPGVNDIVVVTYPVTQGAAGNSLVTAGLAVTITGFPQVTGVALTNPSGGANNNPVIAYKNVASGGFGTYQSAVTKSQYAATIATYPGIIDAVTQAQREIAPADVRWMNVIRVSALTSPQWLMATNAADISDFTNYCQTVSMYSTYFLWQDPIAMPQTVDMDVYIFNSAIPEQVQTAIQTAITNLFAPRPGLMMTNLYPSDLIEAAFNSSPGAISYINVNAPTGPMIVTAPASPIPTFTIIDAGGTLAQGSYAYGISTIDTTGEAGTPVNWVFPQITATTNAYQIELTWPAVDNAATYEIWGRNADVGIGLLASLPATTLTWTDNGSVTPGTPLNSSIANVPIRYNSLGSLTVNVYYADRQQLYDASNPTRLSNG